MNKPQRFKQTSTLKERLAQDTEQLRNRAKAMKPGVALDQVNKRIRENETAVHLSEWFHAPGL